MGQGRAEVVGDVVRDLPQSLHQLLVAVEHGVEIVGEPVEFVIRAGRGDPLAERAPHDAPRRLVDGLDPGDEVDADDHAAAQRQQEQGHRRRDEGAGDDLLQLAEIIGVAPDEEIEPLR